MNRKNIWIHILIAVALIGIAAIAGQISRWQSSFINSSGNGGGYGRGQGTGRGDSKPVAIPRSSRESEPEVLVQFKPGLTLSEIERIAAKYNDRVEDNIESVNGLISLDDLDNASAAKVAEQYASMTDLVDYAEPNFEIKLDPMEQDKQPADEESPVAGAPNDPMFGDQWALSNTGQNGGKAKADVKALEAWAKTKGSEKVVVAVLDTGVDYTHTDLSSNIWFRPDSVPAYNDKELGPINDTYGFNAGDNKADPMDDNGHGTHCAGIIGAEGDNDEGIAGINWKVQIMPLKFLSRSGSGSTKDAIEAINYAIDRKRKGVNVRVISASWGSYGYSRALENVIKAAGEEGILFVAAAGNDSSNNDRRGHYPASYKLPNVISVAALDRMDNLASFSCFGAKSVHIAAPGKDIISTWLGDAYRDASGTSMATPYVSGVAALVAATDPNISVEKLRSRILDTADKVPSLDGKMSTGGRVNAAKAVGK